MIGLGLNLSNAIISSTWNLAKAPLSLAVDTAATDASRGVVQASLEAILLGLVQGITEFLPISSTAHLLIVTQVLGWEDLGEKYFVDAIQFGSVIAVLLYFRADLKQIISGSWAAYQQKDWQREEWKILLGIAIGTLPALTIGYIFRDSIPESAFVIAIASILMSILLGIAEKAGRRLRDFNKLEIKDGLLVGLGQMLALIPGASRSGSTLTTGLLLGLKRDTAARFSFLLGLPTLGLATLFQSRKVIGNLDAAIPLLFGILSAFIFSYLAIAWLLKFLRQQSTWVFVWYRLAFGAAILGAIATGWLPR
ncbi:Undecaprenyl-diphosphatase [Acaryochloris thomasi RCC1774]|uniref:Undecaprenyl-diphosphatase n=1 Tax=Acaryochloris thomasi RCC1774 TaxID=1764569 RepID=A0A2W1JUJ7_9CYAN|nr:undecaprenyl-diphosphate phosphatase [Acaryochloris thomasi]PZD74655.1 Undecaprenyl-diphosphatase [Acaryochloris thomasi RCC1774]